MNLESGIWNLESGIFDNNTRRDDDDENIT